MHILGMAVVYGGAYHLGGWGALVSVFLAFLVLSCMREVE
jgi:hypothetical protein